VGKTGVGKSATANTISGGSYFKSGVSAQSMTRKCEQEKVTRFGKEIYIIDTPGIFDAEANQVDIEREIERCIHLGSPGFHAILYIMEISRVTLENIETLKIFLKFFEKEMENRVIVVFTNGDKLQEMEQSLPEYLEIIPEKLKTFLKICQNRVILFNNKFKKEDTRSSEQVCDLLLMIETLKISNQYAFYTDDAFRKAEEKVQQREKEIQAMLEKKYEEKAKSLETINIELQQERQKEIKELKENYEKKLSNVREEVRKEIESKEW
jgi:predicted GTPase